MIEGANFIDGRWVPAASGDTFERRNPADQDDLIGTFPASGADDVRAAVDALDKGAPEWAATAPERRAAILESAAAHMESRSGELIAELVREEGDHRGGRDGGRSHTGQSAVLRRRSHPRDRRHIPRRRRHAGLHDA